MDQLKAKNLGDIDSLTKDIDDEAMIPSKELSTIIIGILRKKPLTINEIKGSLCEKLKIKGPGLVDILFALSEIDILKATASECRVNEYFLPSQQFVSQETRNELSKELTNQSPNKEKGNAHRRDEESPDVLSKMILRLLDGNPLTTEEIVKKLNIPNLQLLDVKLSIFDLKQVQFIGPPDKKIYFLTGEEKLAEERFKTLEISREEYNERESKRVKWRHKLAQKRIEKNREMDRIIIKHQNELEQAESSKKKESSEERFRTELSS